MARGLVYLRGRKEFACNMILPLSRCENRFDGCPKLLRKDQVEGHQKDCISNRYPCPLCQSRNLNLSAFMLLKHYKENHDNSIMEQPWIFVDLSKSRDVEKCFLYEVNDHLFFVSFKLNESIIFLKSSYVGSNEKAQKIMQKFSLYSKDTGLALFITEWKCCYSFPGFTVKIADIQSNEITIMVELDVNQVELSKMLFFNDIQIDDSNYFGKLNKIFLSSAYLKSSQYSIDSTGRALVIADENDSNSIITFQCCICFEKLEGKKINFIEGRRKSFCFHCLQHYKVKEPDVQINTFSIPEGLQNNLKFFCKWNCSTLIPYYSMPIKHDEDFCPLQPPIRCPKKYCGFQGKPCDLQVHFQSSHKNAKLYLNSGYRQWRIKAESYFLVQDKFVLLKELHNEDNKILTISYCDEKDFNNELQPSLIVYSSGGKISSFRHNLTESRLTTYFSSSIFNVILEKV